MKRHLINVLTIALVSVVAVALAAEEPTARQDNLRRVADWDASNQTSHGGSEVMLIRRALLADRGASRVEILAEACGLSGHTTVEFGIVGETSDRTYEALFLTYARATDIAAALEFIGMPRGRNVSSREQRFWPAGERVVVQVQAYGTNNTPLRHLEDYIIDHRTDKPLVQGTFTYCGSPRVAAPGGGGEMCLADLEPPVSILSFYNEPQTLLDVPRISPQSEVYNTYAVNPATVLPKSQMVRLILTPEVRSDGRPRMHPLQLAMAPAQGPGGVAFTLRDSGGKVRQMNDFGEVLKYMMTLVGDGFDPVISLYFDDTLPLRRARDISKVLQRVEGENGVRIEPPPEGQLYYKAFLPNEEWRERAKRFSQPLEFHVGRATATNTVPPMKLVQTLEDWSDPGSIEPRLTVVDHPVASLEELQKKLAEIGKGLPVMLMFVPSDATLGHFMPVVRKILETHSTVYVFTK